MELTTNKQIGMISFWLTTCLTVSAALFPPRMRENGCAVGKYNRLFLYFEPLPIPPLPGPHEDLSFVYCSCS